MGGLSEEQLRTRRIVGVHEEIVNNVSSTDFPGHWPGQDDSWNLEHFKRNIKVEFHDNAPHNACFSLIGVDASIANAYRRVLIAEVPTLAIEDVFVYDNTSIIQDEVLCHRLGLIPFAGGREGLKWMKWFKKAPSNTDFTTATAVEQDEETDPNAESPSDINTVVLTLKVECRWATTDQDGRDGKQLAREGETDPNLRYINSTVYARDIAFHPAGERQEKFFSGENAIRPVNPDIIVAKLRPGQRIDIRMHAIKGIGADHAKFSPVATASYRLLPHIDIVKPILGADARKFARCFPKGVIGLEDDPESGEKKAVVKDVMRDMVNREALRHDEFKDKVKLGRIRDHFIFSVESSGQFDSDDLFLESIQILKGKAERFRRHLGDLEEGR
ncbi:RBP11-like subunits of RNA polymerase [Polychaeton citri CBS 116435]|uniref:DNA-directed RNA polymerases I and III subunit RPAC1 n=1 Tax=Polychaeton citri CBS 116435 TaxID=1314669 RepID=A0A9P4UKE0_9PEZI|nr:RBP11-like subunits of RNA polymerase [Polychaeton citri CBS 116435]